MMPPNRTPRDTQMVAAIMRQIDARREASGMTRAELAKKSRAHPPEVTRWLNGDRVPALLSILRLLDAVGMRLDAVERKGKS